MSPNSTTQYGGRSKSLHAAFLVILISLIAVGGTLGGFFIGRYTSRDPYIRKASSLLTIENNGTNLYQSIRSGLDEPLTAQAMAKLYGVSAEDRDALAERLKTVAWVPPYRPAPFVGHMARPVLGSNPHINILGFRDGRQSYFTKPDHTVRVFITGGSTAWGSGAPSQQQTISYLLEQILNERVSSTTGYKYEVINTAFPGWSTTQEKLLIQQRLVDMHPDVVLMFSGNNDVHWALQGRDIRWFYSYQDQNYMMLLNELYQSSGHSEMTFNLPASSIPVACSELALLTARNVEEAARATDRVKSRLIFALQPNVVSTAKRLSPREQRLPELQNKSFWDVCYQGLRDRLGRIGAPNYRLLDLSRSFGGIGDNTELFVDSYHFADLGNRLVAEALADQIDWRSILPGPAVLDKREPLQIISFEPTQSVAGKPFNQQADGTSAMRLIPNRVNPNLLVVFDQSVLPTVIAKDAITASISTSLYAAKGPHQIYLADSMTGEVSQTVVFQSR